MLNVCYVEENVITENCLIKILSDYKEVFKSKMGNLKGFEVELKVDPDCKPEFCKARLVPYVLNERIEKELERLVNYNIYEPIQYSKWAAPIVHVLKDDGTVRICGDYKQTINQASLCDKCPVPKPENLFATLNSGEKFSKLDLSHGYQQLLLSLESRPLLTVNTHKGLFQPKTLQFGIHYATGIFQREWRNV